MSILTKPGSVIDAIPNLDDIRRQTTVGAVHSAQAIQLWKQIIEFCGTTKINNSVDVHYLYVCVLCHR